MKDEFVSDRDDLAKRNIMDGDPFLVSAPSHRFRNLDVEPYMPSQAAGLCVCVYVCVGCLWAVDGVVVKVKAGLCWSHTCLRVCVCVGGVGC